MCHSAGWQGADLTIGLLGLPINDYILITAKDAETARKCHLNQVTDGLARQVVWRYANRCSWPKINGTLHRTAHDRQLRRAAS